MSVASCQHCGGIDLRTLLSALVLLEAQVRGLSELVDEGIKRQSGETAASAAAIDPNLCDAKKLRDIKNFGQPARYRCADGHEHEGHGPPALMPAAATA